MPGTVTLARAGQAGDSDDGTAGESGAPTGGVVPRWAGTGGIGSALPVAR